MLRTTAPTSVRTGSALLGVAGVFVLAGCAGTADASNVSTDTGTGSTAESSTSAAGGDAANYADGTYTAEGSYQTPETVEQVSVTLTLADGVVTDVEVTGEPSNPESEQYQSQFIAGISDEVEGVAIDDLNVTRVAGSSLTSGGFNIAVDAIKEQAAA